MKKRGEIIYASRDEGDLEFYKEHPDYNPNPLAPRSTNLNDFVDIEMVENVEGIENAEIIGEQ